MSSSYYPNWRFSSGISRIGKDSLGTKNLLKNKEIKLPEIDLSGITESIEELSNDINSIKDTITDYKERIEIIEKLSGGRF